MKGGLFSPSGQMLSACRAELPRETAGAFSSWDAEHWSRGFRNIAERLGCREPAGIVISGNGPTLVPLGADDIPVFPALLWIDKREKPAAGQKSLFLPKAAWLQEERPDVYERTRSFRPCPEYLSFRLTGEKYAVSPSDEFSEYIWTGASLDFYGMDREKFPPMIRPGFSAGKVGSAAEREFGIAAGTPVYSGGPDFLMTLLGTAVVRPGRVCDRAGTSEGINYCSARPVVSNRLRCLPHIAPGCYNIAGMLSSTGRLFEWFRSLSGQEDVPYEQMLVNLQAASGASDFSRPELPWFFPSMHKGEPWEFSRGMFIGLGADHGKNEMGLAVVESIGFAVRQAVETLENHGCLIEDIRVSGGQARNSTWNQMKADIVGKTLLVPEIEDAELVGNLAAGLAGRGDFSDLPEASENLVRFKAEFRPDRRKHAWYDALYARYRHAYTRFQTALKGC